jgi:hypothetical protein
VVAAQRGKKRRDRRNDHAKANHPRLAPSPSPTHTRSPIAWSGQRPQSDQAMAVKLIRALLAGRAAGDIFTL